MFTETCCSTLKQAVEARDRGTGRLELCEDLSVGGVTPRRELILSVLEAVSPLPVNVLVRPRGGDFVFTPEETQRMVEDIAFCRTAGVSGVVIGALDKDGNVDMATMRALIQEARPMSVTFHRAFDVCADPRAAFEDICRLGCERLLTSGHGPDAWGGRELIAELVRKAAGRIIVMPGCGVTPENIEALAECTRASEFHGTRL